MNNKYRIVGGVAMVLAAVLATGCQHKRGCVNGSCAAPSYGTQNYGASPVANGAGYGSVNTSALPGLNSVRSYSFCFFADSSDYLFPRNRGISEKSLFLL